MLLLLLEGVQVLHVIVLNLTQGRKESGNAALTCDEGVLQCPYSLVVDGAQARFIASCNTERNAFATLTTN